MVKKLSNWSKTKSGTVTHHYEPTNLTELIGIIKDANGSKLRFVGSNMSPNGIAFSNYANGNDNKTDIISAISMKNFNRVINIDTEKKEITAESGVKIQDLIAKLNEKGLGMITIPATTGMTIGGLTQAGCHGTGVGKTTIDNLVKSIKLINAEGDVINLDRTDGDKFFSCQMRVGIFRGAGRGDGEGDRNGIFGRRVEGDGFG